MMNSVENIKATGTGWYKRTMKENKTFFIVKRYSQKNWNCIERNKSYAC